MNYVIGAVLLALFVAFTIRVVMSLIRDFRSALKKRKSSEVPQSDDDSSAVDSSEKEVQK